MGLKKVCPRNPELNLVVTCITPHASHNHLANTEKKNSYYVMLHPTCLSHKSLPENPESSKFKFKVQNHTLPYGALDPHSSQWATNVPRLIMLSSSTCAMAPAPSLHSMSMTLPWCRRTWKQSIRTKRH